MATPKSQLNVLILDHNLCISRAQTVAQATDLDIFWAVANLLLIQPKHKQLTFALRCDIPTGEVKKKALVLCGGTEAAELKQENLLVSRCHTV